MADVAHEFKHAYEFEVGQLDLTANGGGILYDKTDEYTAYARGSLFGTSLYGESNLPPHEKDLPKGPVSINSQFSAEKINGLYERKKVSTMVAYRLNNNTYVFNGGH